MPGPPTPSLSVGDTLNRAVLMIRHHPVSALVGGLVVQILTAAILILAMMLASVLMLALVLSKLQPGATTLPNPQAVIGIFGGAILIVMTGVLPLRPGYALMLLGVGRGQQGDIGTIFSAYRQGGHLLVAFIFLVLAVYLPATIMQFIPVVGVPLSWAYILIAGSGFWLWDLMIVARGERGTHALMRAWQAVRDRFWAVVLVRLCLGAVMGALVVAPTLLVFALIFPFESLGMMLDPATLQVLAQSGDTAGQVPPEVETAVQGMTRAVLVSGLVATVMVILADALTAAAKAWVFHRLVPRRDARVVSTRALGTPEDGMGPMSLGEDEFAGYNPHVVYSPGRLPEEEPETPEPEPASRGLLAASPPAKKPSPESAPVPPPAPATPSTPPPSRPYIPGSRGTTVVPPGTPIAEDTMPDVLSDPDVEIPPRRESGEH